MYTWEMVNFINERNRYIGGDDLLTILSLKLNPQITDWDLLEMEEVV